MTTFADSLKKEIARVARKELKGELAVLRKALVAQRQELANLKRALKDAQAAIRQAGRLPRASPARAEGEGAPASKPSVERFNHENFLKFRQGLGLTQVQMGRLVEASALSVWKWESGRVQPRSGALARIQAAMKMGKRAVYAKVGS